MATVGVKRLKRQPSISRGVLVDRQVVLPPPVSDGRLVEAHRGLDRAVPAQHAAGRVVDAREHRLHERRSS